MKTFEQSKKSQKSVASMIVSKKDDGKENKGGKKKNKNGKAGYPADSNTAAVTGVYIIIIHNRNKHRHLESHLYDSTSPPYISSLVSLLQ